MIKTNIGLLVAGHLLTGLLVAASCHEVFPHPLTVVFLALILGDAGLLGIWLAFGGGRWPKRVGAILAATIYVGGLGWLAFGDVSLVIFFDPPIALVAVGLAVFRRKGLKIAIPSSSASEGLQFSIRHLLGVTALVALLLTIGRGIRAITAGASTVLKIGFLILAPAIICISAMVVALTSLWASLGSGRPSQRLLVVLLVLALLGILQSYYLANVMSDSAMFFVAWTAMSVLIAVVINGSLLVFRSSGYRLVRSTTSVEGLISDRHDA